MSAMGTERPLFGSNAEKTMASGGRHCIVCDIFGQRQVACGRRWRGYKMLRQRQLERMKGHTKSLALEKKACTIRRLGTLGTTNRLFGMHELALDIIGHPLDEVFADGGQGSRGRILSLEHRDKN